MAETKQRTTPAIVKEVANLLRARHALIWVVTHEERRAEKGIAEAAQSAKYEPCFWDLATGATDLMKEPVWDEDDGVDVHSPVSVLRAIGERPKREVWVLRDLPLFLNAAGTRQLKSLVMQLQDVRKRTQVRAIVVLTPSPEIPDELRGISTLIDYPLPSRDEISEILEDALEPAEQTVTADERQAIIDAAVGLTAEEVGACFAKSLVELGKVDPEIVHQEKKRVIDRERVLEWYDPDPRGLDAVGGLHNLKTWLNRRKVALSADAREYGLPAPKGVLLVGIPGCGKSLTAKALATAWKIPLLRLDLGALKSKYVGESEANLRKALKVAEAVAPCALWVDEIEKSFQGAASGAQDGGVSGDQLGTVLTWLQDRRGSVMVVATANEIEGMPPELYRRGRFDETFFVDLPTRSERVEILAASLTLYERDPISEEDLFRVADITKSWTGAELAGLIPDAMFAAYEDGKRALSTEDLLAATEGIIPMATSAKRRVNMIKEWAKGRARPASLKEEEEIEKTETQGFARPLDIPEPDSSLN